MQKYLDYVKQYIISNEVLTDDMKSDFLSRLNKDITFYLKYKNSLSMGNMTKPTHWNTHRFFFHTGEDITLSWDIDKAYQKTASMEFSNSSIEEFEMLLSHDLYEDETEISRIFLEVKSIQKHKYDPVLVCYMIPFNFYILLDGRHRYVERKKFGGNINYFILRSDQLIDCFVSLYDRALYILLHNISIMNDASLGKCHFTDFL